MADDLGVRWAFLEDREKTAGQAQERRLSLSRARRSYGARWCKAIREPAIGAVARTTQGVPKAWPRRFCHDKIARSGLASIPNECQPSSAGVRGDAGRRETTNWQSFQGG